MLKICKEMYEKKKEKIYEGKRKLMRLFVERLVQKIWGKLYQGFPNILRQ